MKNYQAYKDKVGNIYCFRAVGLWKEPIRKIKSSIVVTTTGIFRAENMDEAKKKAGKIIASKEDQSTDKT